MTRENRIFVDNFNKLLIRISENREFSAMSTSIRV